MKYAVIKTGGKQYRVSEGDVIDIERIDSKDKKVSFDVLLYSEGTASSTKIGKPTVKDAEVKALILEEVKGPKIRISKFKAKAKYRRTTGHRQSLSKVKIEKINIK